MYWDEKISWHELGRRVCKSIISAASGLAFAHGATCAVNEIASRSSLGSFGAAIGIVLRAIGNFHGHITADAVFEKCWPPEV